MRLCNPSNIHVSDLPTVLCILRCLNEGKVCCRRRAKLSCKNALQLALKYGVMLHSDACLGGFVLPFARKLGYKVPPFDFSVPGVTSMSVDTHKFGMAHKGTSVVLYRSADIRRHQYTRITEWSGGLYISPGSKAATNL